MKPTCLYRPYIMPPEELQAATKYFNMTPYPGQVPANQTVLARYSVLPFAELVAGELALVGSKLINSTAQHQYVADAMNWSSVGACLEKAGLTPWSRDNWYNLPEGQYIVKGKTNSRKGRWRTSMYCPSVADIPNVVSHLLDDEMIAQQGLIVRPYVPLLTYDVGINEQPVTAEFRTFWYRDPAFPGMSPVMIERGFYWSSWPDYEEQANDLWDRWNKQAYLTTLAAAKLISPEVPFFVLDMARTQDGRWIVIEVNDAQQSGLSCINSDDFYRKMADAMSGILVW